MFRESIGNFVLANYRFEENTYIKLKEVYKDFYQAEGREVNEGRAKTADLRYLHEALIKSGDFITYADHHNGIILFHYHKDGQRLVAPKGWLKKLEPIAAKQEIILNVSKIPIKRKIKIVVNNGKTPEDINLTNASITTLEIQSPSDRCSKLENEFRNLQNEFKCLKEQNNELIKNQSTNSYNAETRLGSSIPRAPKISLASLDKSRKVQMPKIRNSNTRVKNFQS
jgi:hypothetical protein